MATLPLTPNVQQLMAESEPQPRKLPKLTAAERTTLQTGLALNHQQLDEALATTSPSQLHELIQFVDECIAPEHRIEWFDTRLPALQNQTPRKVILKGQTVELLVAFERMYQGTPL